MDDPPPPPCPYCGSRRLIAHRNSRRVFISPDDERIPLLTVNSSMDLPIIVEEATTLTCSCPWDVN